MKNLSVLVLVVLLATMGLFAHAQLIDETRYSEFAKPASSYSASWWASSQYDERDGYFEGAIDCLTDTVHVPKGFFSASRGYNSDDFAKEITKYYSEHPADSRLSVIEVWRKTSQKMGEDNPQPKGGDVYTNPHGWFFGGWYRVGSEAERYGFLEGYIGCLRTYGQDSGPPQTYSRPIHYYDDKIWDYATAHQKGKDESVADILYRFRDMPKSKPPKAK